PPRCAAAHGNDRRGRPAMRLSRPDLRPLRRLRPRPRPDAHPRARPRPELPRGGAGRVRVDLDGRSAKADVSTIVRWPYHNDTKNWPHKHTMYPIKAAAMLMVDNLMDLTHLGYVHTTTIGGNPAQHLDAKMQTERTPLGLKFTRWMLNSVPPPTYVMAAGFQGRIDRCQRFEFIAPGSILQWTGAAEAGAHRAGDTRRRPPEVRPCPSPYP